MCWLVNPKWFVSALFRVRNRRGAGRPAVAASWAGGLAAVGGGCTVWCAIRGRCDSARLEGGSGSRQEAVSRSATLCLVLFESALGENVYSCGMSKSLSLWFVCRAAAD